MINPRRYYYSKPQKPEKEAITSTKSPQELSTLISSNREEVQSILNINTIPIEIDDVESFPPLRFIKSFLRNSKSIFHRINNPMRLLSIISLCFLFLISIQINNSSISFAENGGTVRISKKGRSIYELGNTVVNCESCRGAFKIRNGGKVLLKGEEEGVIPLVLEKNLGDFVEAYKFKKKKREVEGGEDREDIPIFLHIPRSGGLTVRDVLGSCLKLVLTADFGNKEEQYESQNSLQFLQTQHKALLLNVDTSYAKGIQHTKDMSLLESNRNLVDVIVTKDLYSLSSTLLDNTKYQGKVFIMFRDPIERLVSLYHYLGIASWDVNYDPDLQYISLEMFARSTRKDNNNYMVRLLSNTMDVEDDNSITEEHLDIAKEVLRKKCIIGLLNHKQESITRLQQYFKWKMNPAMSSSSPFDQSSFCQEKLLTWGWSNKNAHPNIEETSPAYELLQKKNALDIALYEYAKVLYEEQGEMIGTMVKEERVRVREEQMRNYDRVKKEAEMGEAVKNNGIRDIVESYQADNSQEDVEVIKNLGVKEAILTDELVLNNEVSTLGTQSEIENAPENSVENTPVENEDASNA